MMALVCFRCLLISHSHFFGKSFRMRNWYIDLSVQSLQEKKKKQHLFIQFFQNKNNNSLESNRHPQCCAWDLNKIRFVVWRVRVYNSFCLCFCFQRYAVQLVRIFDRSICYEFELCLFFVLPLIADRQFKPFYMRQIIIIIRLIHSNSIFKDQLTMTISAS